jgi:isocitrate dehydrogenase kinase/phosphatase
VKVISASAPAKPPLAGEIAELILAGFDRHFSVFRKITHDAARIFREQDWRAGRNAVRTRIDLYDTRVGETVAALHERLGSDEVDESLWQEVKLRYAALLYEHRQPELAESYYNSVFCRLFDRRYYNNDNIFVRPATSTEHLEMDTPIYRSYYPTRDGLAPCLRRVLENCPVDSPFEDFERDVDFIAKRWERDFPPRHELRQHFQLQVLTPLFYRNKAAYVVGRAINGTQRIPFVLALLNNGNGAVYVDTLVSTSADIASVFSFARAYFMVDTETPAALVRFLLSIQPSKSAADLYTLIGFQKHGKTQFYRDFLHHLTHSDDLLVPAPGTKGMVMLVFTLLSYPYVFKVIRDNFRPPKECTPEQVMAKYRMVKQHDRVGRMADTWEYSYAAFPLERFTPGLLEELKTEAGSNLSFEGDQVVIKHLYIERRLMPLDLYLRTANDERVDHVIRDYGNAIKQIAAADIFPGDLLFKNFGVTGHDRVIFYDYDEIVPMHECRFRELPAPHFPEDEFAAEPWYTVEPGDVFPEEFGTYLLVDPRVRRAFLNYHADLLHVDWWHDIQQVIHDGGFADVFPYDDEQRFLKR